MAVRTGTMRQCSLEYRDVVFLSVLQVTARYEVSLVVLVTVSLVSVIVTLAVIVTLIAFVATPNS